MQRYDLEYSSVFSDSSMVPKPKGDYVTFLDCEEKNRVLKVDKTFLREMLGRAVAELEKYGSMDDQALVEEMRAGLEATQ